MMNKKGQGHGFRNFFVIVILLAILFVMFYYIGNKIPIVSSIYSLAYGNEVHSIMTLGQAKADAGGTTTSTPGSRNISAPPITSPWCKVQVMQVGVSNEDPISDQILGWDSVSNCCVREVTGYDCAIINQTTTDYCYTSNIGGAIKYVTINGYYGDVTYYQNYINNLDKGPIMNKPCDFSIYPQPLQPVVVKQ